MFVSLRDDEPEFGIILAVEHDSAREKAVHWMGMAERLERVLMAWNFTPVELCGELSAKWAPPFDAARASNDRAGMEAALAGIEAALGLPPPHEDERLDAGED
jgi:hypothetical protein